MSFMRYERGYMMGWHDAELGAAFPEDEPLTIIERAYTQGMLDYLEGNCLRYDEAAEHFPVQRGELEKYLAIPR